MIGTPCRACGRQGPTLDPPDGGRIGCPECGGQMPPPDTARAAARRFRPWRIAALGLGPTLAILPLGLWCVNFARHDAETIQSRVAADRRFAEAEAARLEEEAQELGRREMIAALGRLASRRWPDIPPIPGDSLAAISRAALAVSERLSE